MWENTRDSLEEHAISTSALETLLTLASFHFCNLRLAGLETSECRHNDVDKCRQEYGREEDQVDGGRQSVAVGAKAFAH